MKIQASSVVFFVLLVSQVAVESNKIWKKGDCKYANKVTTSQAIKLKVSKYPVGDTPAKLTIQNNPTIVYTLDKKKLGNEEFVIFIKLDADKKDCAIDKDEIELEVIEEKEGDKIEVIHGNDILVLGVATNMKVILKKNKDQSFLMKVENSENDVKLRVDGEEITVEKNKKIFRETSKPDQSEVEILDLAQDKTLKFTTYQNKLSKNKCQLMNSNKAESDHYIRLNVSKKESEETANLEILTTQTVTYNLKLGELNKDFVLFVKLKGEPVECKLDKDVELGVVDLKENVKPVIGLGDQLTVVGEAKNKKIDVQKAKDKKYEAKVMGGKKDTKLKVDGEEVDVAKGKEKMLPSAKESATESVVEIVDLEQDDTLHFTSYDAKGSSPHITPASYILLGLLFFCFYSNL